MGDLFNFTPDCPCGNGCEDSHDSRAFGPASCLVCVGDLDDHHAFNGGVVCRDCITVQTQLLGVADPSTDELMLDDWQVHLKHFGESYQPTGEEVMAVMREENPDACCDWHSQPEATESDPCATWQGGSNFAPNFGEEVQGEGVFDCENELFAAHIHHLIDNKGFTILELLEGWADLDCPACGTRVELEREGNGVRADCFHCEVGSSLRWVFP